MSSGIQAINLQDLRARQERGAPIVGASAILESYPAAKLQRLLRYHRPDRVTGNDVERRSSFDELLTYFGEMEVACIAEYVPASLPKDYIAFARSKLENDALRTYYERHYPLLLPQLHRRRIRGEWSKRERGPELPSLFIAFSEISRSIEEDEDIDSFLWFLEDGSIGGQSLEDLLDIMGDPEAFAAAMLQGSPQSSSGDDMWEALRSESGLKDPAAFLKRFQQPAHELDPALSALHGFQKFLFFCRDFHSLLELAARYPYTQSAMWHQHAYWFDQLSDDLRPYLRMAIDRFAAWQSDTREADSAARESAAAELRAAVDALTSPRYGTVLRAAYNSLKPAERVVLQTSIGAPSIRRSAKKRPAPRKAAHRKQHRVMAKKAFTKRYAAPARKKSLAKKKSGKRSVARKRVSATKKISRKKMSR